MKEKITAFITLGFIFSLFFYYKAINPVNNDVSYMDINTSSGVNVEVEPYVHDAAYNDNNKFIDCELDVVFTDDLNFSDAFKYYRNCNGRNTIFSWNGKEYSTMLLSELDSKVNQKNTRYDNDNLVLDKNHLKLQNQLVGDNTF